MLGIALAAALLVGCSMIVGQGVALVAGHRAWAWWSPGVGCCLLIALAGLLIRAPGHGWTVVAAAAVLTAAAALVPAVRAAVLGALPQAVPAVAVTLGATLLPFAVSGRAGILGVGINNDMSAHLTTAWWLQHRQGAPGVGAIGGALPDVGYPLGPHGLADALSLALHISLVHAFDAVLVVSAPLIALVALGALPARGRVVRVVVAALVGLSYLTVSYLVQGAFKETLEGLVLVTTVLVVAWLVRGEGAGWRAGLPLGVVLGGAVHVYSYPGLAWPLGVVALAALFDGGMRALIRAAAGASLAAVVLIAPAARQIYHFYNSPFSGENHMGNLVHAVPPIEALGTWLSADFRFYPHPLWPSLVVGAVAALALAVAVIRLLAARRRALPLGLIVAVTLYLYTVATKSIYVSGKALAVLAPLATLTLPAGLLRRASARAALALVGIAVVVAGGAVASSFVALRDARVGPTTHEQELASLRPRLGHHHTLFLGKDDFAQWELHGTNVAVGRFFYAPSIAPVRPSKPVGTPDQIDFDNFLPETLDHFQYVISSNTPYQSTPPANFHLVTRTQSYALWKRRGRTPLRYPLDPHGAPGAILSCSSPFGRLRLGGAGPRGTAGVLPRPVVATQDDWRGQPRRAGESATLRVRLPAGTWDLSLQYVSSTGLDISAPGLRRSLPASLDRLGPYFRAGTVRMAHGATVQVTATGRKLNALGRLLGGPGATRALNSPDYLPLDGVAFTRHGAHEHVIPVRSACGRYVDWVAPRAGAS